MTYESQDRKFCPIMDKDCVGRGCGLWNGTNCTMLELGSNQGELKQIKSSLDKICTFLERLTRKI